MSARQYGTTPGTSLSVSSYPYAGAGSGEANILVIFGRGDPSAGEASVNDPTFLRNAVDAETQFGPGTRIEEAMRNSSRNGSDRDKTYGVMTEEIPATGEALAGGTGQLANFPVASVDDPSEITVTRTSDSVVVDVEYRYESTPITPSGPDTAAINPFTGEFEAADADDYEVDYAYLDWQAALNAADAIVTEDEAALYHVESCASTVVDLLDAKIEELRPHWRLINGLAGAEPNATTSQGDPTIDVETYSHTFDSDALFLAGPVTRPNGRTILGGIAGKMVGNDMTDPILGRSEPIEGYEDGVVQSLLFNEDNPLRDAGVMPVATAGDDVYLKGNDSTYQYDNGTANDPDSLPTWTRDYYRRRIVDQLIAYGHAAGKIGENRVISEPERTLKLIRESMVTEINRMQERGLLQRAEQSQSQGEEAGTQSTPETPDSQASANRTGEGGAYFVEASKIGVDTVGLSVRVAPTGILKDAQIDLSIARGSQAIQDGATS